MLLSQWKSKQLIVSPIMLTNILKSRRAVRGLAKLLPLFEESDKVNLSYRELAKLMGYENKSGAFKAIKKLERLGVVAIDSDGYLNLTMEGIIIGNK